LKDFQISSVLLYGAIPMADFQREPKRWIMVGNGTLKKDSHGNILMWDIRMPWEFVLANQTSPLKGWQFTDNSENYAHKVVYEKEHRNDIQE